MPMLRDLQAAFAAALLHGERAAEAWIDGSGVAAAIRLDVHRNTILSSLTDVLAATYPVVRRLVDARFFAYAANEFVRAHPPRRPSLAEYGGDFADFLAGFGPCRDLVYLPDVARLEWAIAGIARAVERPALASQALADVADAKSLAFVLQPTMALVTSLYPIDAIWRANQPGATEAAIDLAAGPAALEIRKYPGGIALHRLDAAVFAFRAALAERRTLGEAAETALALDARFDLGRALAALFHDGAIIAVNSARSRESKP